MIEYENLSRVNAPFFNEYLTVFEEVMNKGWYILGEHVTLFESEFSNYNKVKHTIGLASGLDALILGINVFDFPPGSEIIVPSNTYIATILAIVRNGFKPVLVEPDKKTFNIDPFRIEEKINEKTKAVIVVHLYGKCCDMTPILEISKKHGLRVIEDCAQSHGARYKGKKAGSFGDIGAFSFYPTKNLGAMGDGGAITTNDDEIADRLLYLRNYGSKIKYYNKYVGYNSRLDEMQAAFLRIKLKHLDRINAHKRKLAESYRKNISGNQFTLPDVQEDFFDVYHIFCVLSESRNKLREYLGNAGIKTEVHYPVPPHQQEGYREIISGSFPISEHIHKSTLSLPISTFHTEKDIYKITEALNAY